MLCASPEEHALACFYGKIPEPHALQAKQSSQFVLLSSFIAAIQPLSSSNKSPTIGTSVGGHLRYKRLAAPLEFQPGNVSWCLLNVGLSIRKGVRYKD